MRHSSDPVRFEISIDRATVRRALLVGGTLVLFATAGVAFGVPVTFTDGSVTAAGLNKNFANLERRVAALEKRESGNGTYSDGATFCGATPASYNGNSIGGYPGAKAACQAACGNSPTAHMCVTAEIVRAQQVGLSMADGWTSSPDAQGADCAGWDNKVPVGPPYGPAYFTQYGFVTEDDCSHARPILCCD